MKKRKTKLNKDWFDIFKHILAKIFSARFLATIMLTTAFCIVTFKAFDLLITNLTNTNEKILSIIKEVFFFIMGAFIATINTVITSYFTRQDRSSPNGN